MAYIHSYLITSPINPSKPFIGVVGAPNKSTALEKARIAWGEGSRYDPLSPDQVSEYSGRGVIVFIYEE